MAEGKDIQISIKTTADTSGAKAAEEALKKVDVAVDGAGVETVKTAKQVAREQEKAAKEAEAAVKKSEREKAKAAKAAADEMNRGTRSMRAGMQNLSYQAADVAVQLEMGTSAARVFSQQGSQMLAVLGPWGALAGAALAIGGALLSSGQSSEDAAEQVTADAEEMSEGMKALKQFTDDAAEALEMERLGASNEAFAARIEAVEELNKRLERQLEIAKQLRDIELQKQDAVAAADIAEIEAGDMPEAEKAKKVSAIRAEMQERERQQQLNSIRLEENKAKVAVEAAKAKEAAAQANVAANRENFDRNEKAVQEAESAFGKAPDEVERLKAELEELAMRDARGRLAFGSEGGGQRGQEFREEVEGEEFNLLSDIKLQAPEKLAETLTEAAKYRDAAKDELKAAEDALRDAQKGVSSATGKQTDVSRVSDAQRDLINAQGGSAARISESQRAAEERRETERKVRESKSKKPRSKEPRANARESEEERRALDEEEVAAPGLVDKTFDGTRGSRFYGVVEGAKKKIEDGATAPEYDQLAAEIEGFVNAITGIDAKKKADIAALAKHFRNLSERVRKLESK